MLAFPFLRECHESVSFQTWLSVVVPDVAQTRVNLQCVVVEMAEVDVAALAARVAQRCSEELAASAARRATRKDGGQRQDRRKRQLARQGSASDVSSQSAAPSRTPSRQSSRDGGSAIADMTPPCKPNPTSPMSDDDSEEQETKDCWADTERMELLCFW